LGKKFPDSVGLSLTTTPAYTKFNFYPGSAPSANRIVTSAYIVHVIVQD